jgi:regulator of nucleoside diphosphate kinase
MRLEISMTTTDRLPSGAPATPPLLLSSLDYGRLEALLDTQPLTDARGLAAELERAQVLDPREIPGDVITMNSTARFRDEDSGEEREITLVYPHDAGAPGSVSILAPVGSALLGLRVGHAIEWPMPGGRTVRLRVLSISHQPEAAGELHR